MATFQFQPNKVHRLRLINAGADGIQRFAIDGHKMTIIANDFVPVVPYESDIISLGVGQRTDIIVNATADPGSSWFMRSNFTLAPCGISYQPLALAAVYYPGADRCVAPSSVSDPSTYSSTFCQNVSSETAILICYKTNLNRTLFPAVFLSSLPHLQLPHPPRNKSK